MRTSIAYYVSQAQKGELIIEGNYIEIASNSASIQQATTVKNKDIRKFLDDIYISQNEQYSRLMSKISVTQLQKQDPGS